MAERKAATAAELGAELVSRLAFEEIILNVSAQLVAATTDNVDGAITQALGRVGRFIGTGRSYAFRFSADGSTLSATHEYCVAGVPSALATLRDVSVEPLRWGVDLIKDRQLVEASHPHSLPPEAETFRHLMDELGITSLLTVPLYGAGDVIGGIAFEWFGEPGAWSNDTTTLLRVAAELIGGALTRCKAEQELRATEERLRSFIASTDDAVFCYEAATPIAMSLPLDEQFARAMQARLVVANEVYARARGHESGAAMMGLTLAEVASESLEALRHAYEAFIAQGGQLADVLLEATGPDGLRRVYLAQGRAVIRDGAMVRLWGLLKDVTEQRRAEEERRALESQLRQAQKMESIGLLAGGVAHDFNNLLLVITNYASLARDEVFRDPPVALRAVGNVLAASERASELTQRLLTFSRRQPMRREAIDLNERIRETVALLRRLIREEIEIDFQPGEELGVINADRSQIEQTLVNLCVNASDAIRGVGRITLRTEVVKLDAAFVKTHPWARTGRFALLTVSDTGEGMSPEVRDRIFEPFFTTKEPGKGTGLGLSMVYGIVTQHEGLIHVEAEVDKGATFQLYWPTVARPAVTWEKKPDGPLRVGTETVLVAEDHDMVRDVVNAILTRAGYRVILARDGGEAKELFEQHRDEIDLVLLDAVMPVVSGLGVMEHVLRVRPDLPVLVASGYAAGVFPSSLFSEQGQELLRKPYDADQLLRTIRRRLDRSPTG